MGVPGCLPPNVWRRDTPFNNVNFHARRPRPRRSGSLVRNYSILFFASCGPQAYLTPTGRPGLTSLVPGCAL
eukprot:3499274-Rhodomonas_salina.1